MRGRPLAVAVRVGAGSSVQHFEYAFDERQAQTFDFEPKYLSFNESWGDRECGVELLLDTKGEGLAQVLTDLMEVRRARQPSPISPLPANARTDQPSAARDVYRSGSVRRVGRHLPRRLGDPARHHRGDHGARTVSSLGTS
jgi:hypothetical protein